MTRTAHPLRTILGVGVVGLLAVVAVACGSSSPGATRGAKKLDTVTVMLDWTPNTNHSGLYLAQAEGWYRAAGLNVAILQPGDADPLQLLAAHKADVAISAQEDIIPARAKGLPVVAIAAIVQHNTSSLLSLSSTGITVPEELVGHTYGGYGGQLENALVKKLASCSGADPSKIKFANVGDADYRVGLTHHQYDFVWIFDGWEKIEMTAIDHLKVNTIPFIDNIKCIPDWYTPMMATTESEIADNSPVLERFMAVTKRGYEAAMAHPAEAADALIKPSPDLNPKLVRLSAAYLAARYAAVPTRWGEQQTEVWVRFADFLRTAGLITKPFPVKGAFTNHFVHGS